MKKIKFICLFFILFSTLLQAQTPTLQVGIVADHKTFLERGNLSVEDLKSRMGIVNNLSIGLLDNDVFMNIIASPTHRGVIMEEVNFNENDVNSWSADIDEWYRNNITEIQCIDVLVYFRFQSTPGGISSAIRLFGEQSGIPVLIVNWNPHLTSRFTDYGNVVAHEMAHAFKAIHVDDFPLNELCSDFCSLPIEENPLTCSEFLTESSLISDRVSYLMCPGSCDPSVTINPCLIHPINLGRMSSVIDQHADGLLQEPDPNCENCTFTVICEPSTTTPNQISCGGETVFDVKLTLINDCLSTKNVNAEIVIFNEEIDLFLPSPDWYYSYNTVNGSSYFKLNDLDFELGETKVFNLKAQIPADLDIEEFKMRGKIRSNDGPLPNQTSNTEGSQVIPIHPRYATLVGGDSQTTNLSDLITDAKVLPPSQSPYNTQNLMLEGTLIVDETYTFGAATDEESHISVDVFSKIIVESGSILTLENVLLDNCRNAMWEGIEVQNGGLLIIKHSKVYNAKTGVLSEPWSYIEVSNTEFYNNHVAMKLTGGAGNPAIFSDLGPFYNNWIHADDNLLWPYLGEQAEAGLIVQDNPSVLIGAPYIGTTDTPIFEGISATVFEGMKNGLVVRNGDVRIENTEFYDIEKVAITLSGGALNLENYDLDLENTFLEVGTGIKADNATLSVKGQAFVSVDRGIELSQSSYGSSTISKNHFTNFTHNGIKIWQADQFDISENYFNSGSGTYSTSTALSINNFSASDLEKTICGNNFNLPTGRIALYMYNTDFVSITDNVIQMNNLALYGMYIADCNNLNVLNNSLNTNNMGSNSGRGIMINGTFASTVACNAVLDYWNGIDFFGACDQTDFRGNTMQGCDLGLVLGLYPNIGSTIIGEQTHKGNVWYGSSTSDAYFGGAPNQVSTSTFFVDSDEQTSYLASNNMTNWFIDEDDMNSTFLCPNEPSDGSSPCSESDGFVEEFVHLQPIDLDLVAGNPISGFTDPSLIWTVKKHLLRRIDKDNTGLNNNQTSSFLSSAQGSSYFALHEVANTYRAYRSDPVYQSKKTQIESNMLQLKSTQEELRDLYVNRLDGNVGNSAFNQARAAKVGLLQNLKTEINQWMIENETIKADYLNQALNLNNSVVATLLPAQNEQLVNASFFDGLDVNDIATLLPIAEQCPLDGGDAVHVARSLLNFLEQAHSEDDYTLCERSYGREDINSAARETSVNVFPNPANENISISAQSNSQSTIQFFDWRGSLVKSILLEKGAVKIDINTKDWPAGVYYYQVGTSASKKLVIVH